MKQQLQAIKRQLTYGLSAKTLAEAGQELDRLIANSLEERTFEELDMLLNEHANSSIFNRISENDRTCDAFWHGEPIGIVLSGRQFFVQIKVTER